MASEFPQKSLQWKTSVFCISCLKMAEEGKEMRKHSFLASYMISLLAGTS